LNIADITNIIADKTQNIADKTQNIADKTNTIADKTKKTLINAPHPPQSNKIFSNRTQKTTSK